MDNISYKMTIGKKEYTLAQLIRGQTIAIMLLQKNELSNDLRKEWLSYSPEFKNRCGADATKGIFYSEEQKMTQQEYVGE